MIKLIKLSILIFLSNSISAATTTYTVTSINPNDQSSIQKILSDVKLNFNHSNDIIINLNLPIGISGDALIPISESLIINNFGYTYGSLTIQADPNSIIKEQGFQYIKNSNTSSFNRFAIRIISSNFITINNLTFKDFYYLHTNGTQLSSGAISLASTKGGVVNRITNNKFYNNHKCISSLDTEIYVEGNVFYHTIQSITTYGVEVNNTVWGNSGSNKKSEIINNTFIGDVSIMPTSYIGALFEPINVNLGSKVCGAVHIKNNKIDGSIKYGFFNGITLTNTKEKDQVTPVNISDNIIGVHGTAVKLVNPRYWYINDNKIDGAGTAFHISASYWSKPTQNYNDWGINFWDNNNNVTLIKKNVNSITNCYYSFKVYYMSSASIRGQNIDGRITVNSGYGTVISRNLIKNLNNSSQKPIDLQVYNSWDWVGNNNLSALSINNVVYNYPNLTFNLAIQDWDLFGSYTIEFFAVDANNNLVKFLDDMEVNYSSMVNIPYTFKNLILPPGGKIGATITSRGPGIQSYPYDAGYSLGTSEVVYPSTPIVFDPIPCSDAEDCHSFKPEDDQEYWASAWVKVETTDQVISYKNGSDGPNIVFAGYGSNGFTSSDVLTPSGDIIDGWQRMVGKVNIPDYTDNVFLELNSSTSGNTYFDDIRIHPYNASMKSYVYDGETFWLTSELDDNNYATFYEYDSEGGLVRIKKETARGIVTIQETRSHNSTEE